MTTLLNTENQKEDKLIPAPSWCAAMNTIIEFQEVAEQMGKNFSEALREALDEKIGKHNE